MQASSKLVRQRFWRLHVMDFCCVTVAAKKPTQKTQSWTLTLMYMICFNESPLQMMKHASYFVLKLFSFLRYLPFCLYLLVMQENDLIRTLRLICQYMTSQTGQQIIAIRITSNILKQPSRGVLKKRCSENMHQIYRRPISKVRFQ